MVAGIVWGLIALAVGGFVGLTTVSIASQWNTPGSQLLVLALGATAATALCALVSWLAIDAAGPTSWVSGVLYVLLAEELVVTVWWLRGVIRHTREGQAA